MTARKAAIVGGGVIGGGWAARFLLQGWDVAVFDPAPEAGRKIDEVLANARRSLPSLYDTGLPGEGALTFSGSLADAVAGVAWVQESVPERLEVKHKVLADIAAHAPADCVIASSTSGFKPSDLQSGVDDAGRIVVCHPFNPVYLLPLVEVVPSDQTDTVIGERAVAILEEIGMRPLVVGKEIDAHIADRLLEAVWREALWLVNDGVAETHEIDAAIRYGFGLRWAQMGLFETYRIAGGEQGMRHFLAQFGPALEWPWTKLMDVPDLTDDLVDAISEQSDRQAGDLSVRELERIRDDNLVGMLRALKKTGWAAGALLNTHEQLNPVTDECGLVETVNRQIPQSWTDYNGHMSEAHYLEVFSQATDHMMQIIGADPDYIASGFSYFTVETHIRHLDELVAGEGARVLTRVLDGSGKKLHLFHELLKADGTRVATGEHMLIHVDLETRAACPPKPAVADRLTAYAAQHATLGLPDGAGSAIGKRG